eukprot:symbB.v1.2.035189.t1/scaffold4666.1/size36743/3
MTDLEEVHDRQASRSPPSTSPGVLEVTSLANCVVSWDALGALLRLCGFRCTACIAWSCHEWLKLIRDAAFAFEQWFPSRILVLGGLLPSRELTRSVEVFDGKWQCCADMTCCRAFGAAVCTSDGRVLVIGGKDGDEALDSVEEYNLDSNTWKSLSPLTRPRWGLAAVEYRNQVYVLGGRNDEHILNCEILKRSEWQLAPSLIEGRSFPTAAVLGGDLFVLGGGPGRGPTPQACPVAVAVGKLAHSLVTFRRDWHGDMGKAIASEYLAVALCPHGPIAPKHGHIARSEVLENRLEAVAFAATAQELVGCGVQIEIHLHVSELGEVTTFLGPCIGIACREQCATWEASHYLRFSCTVEAVHVKEVIPCTTASGHAKEPSLHTLITCRLPRRLLPKWLGGPSTLDALQLELQEMDGIFSKSIPFKLCSFQRPKERGILGCLKPALGAGQFSQLLDDWLRYHRLMGVDHFMLYDVDGSIEPLLSGGTFSTLLQQGRLTYVPRFSGHMGPRIENLTAELWRRGLGQICVQPRHVNHCLALSRSAGFEWFLYLRGMDKYLHSDVDPSSGMLRRFLDALPSQIL